MKLDPPSRTQMRILLILGGWLIVVGITDSFIQGPGALICSFFGLGPLIGGLRVRAKLQQAEAAKKDPLPLD